MSAWEHARIAYTYWLNIETLSEPYYRQYETVSKRFVANLFDLL